MIMEYFERKGYHCEKFLKASDIVWFVSSARNFRRHWPECVGCVNITFCFTGAIAVLQGPISA